MDEYFGDCPTCPYRRAMAADIPPLLEDSGVSHITVFTWYYYGLQMRLLWLLAHEFPINSFSYYFCCNAIFSKEEEAFMPSETSFCLVGCLVLHSNTTQPLWIFIGYLNTALVFHWLDKQSPSRLKCWLIIPFGLNGSKAFLWKSYYKMALRIMLWEQKVIYPQKNYTLQLWSVRITLGSMIKLEGMPIFTYVNS